MEKETEQDLINRINTLEELNRGLIARNTDLERRIELAGKKPNIEQEVDFSKIPVQVGGDKKPKDVHEKLVADIKKNEVKANAFDKLVKSLGLVVSYKHECSQMVIHSYKRNFLIDVRVDYETFHTIQRALMND